MDMKKQRRRARKRRDSLPEPIGSIISEHYPGLLRPDIEIRRNPNTGIVSFQSENGLPWDDVEKLIYARMSMKNKTEGGYK